MLLDIHKWPKDRVVVIQEGVNVCLVSYCFRLGRPVSGVQVVYVVLGRLQNLNLSLEHDVEVIAHRPLLEDHLAWLAVLQADGRLQMLECLLGSVVFFINEFPQNFHVFKVLDQQFDLSLLSFFWRDEQESFDLTQINGPHARGCCCLLKRRKHCLLCCLCVKHPG